jgi:hypothetical protein
MFLFLEPDAGRFFDDDAKEPELARRLIASALRRAPLLLVVSGTTKPSSIPKGDKAGPAGVPLPSAALRFLREDLFDLLGEALVIASLMGMGSPRFFPAPGPAGARPPTGAGTSKTGSVAPHPKSKSSKKNAQKSFGRTATTMP